VTHHGKRLGIGIVGMLLVLSACGGGTKQNGVDKLSGAQALAKVKAAVAGVQTVHVQGSFNQNGGSLGIDLHLKQGSGSGRLTIGGGTLDVVRIGNDAYFRGDAKAFEAIGDSAAQAAVLGGKWIKASATSGPGQAFAGFLDLNQLLANVLKPTGSVSVGTDSDVNGEKTVALVDHGDNGGTLYIALVGKPLPVKVVKPGSSGGTASFDQYDAAVTVTAPKGAIDLSQVGG
jgi:hypothetical protein